MNNNIKKIVKELYPFDYSVASEDSDRSIEIYKKYLNFKIHRFKTGQQLNEWKIPKSIKVKKAQVICEGKIIFDLNKKNLSVISQCKNINITVNYNTLIKNIFYSEVVDDAIPYGWVGLYNQKLDWGLCISKNSLKRLNKKKKYKINIKTK